MASPSDRAPSGSAEASVVVVTGAAGALGRRVCTLAANDPAVGRVVAVDRRPVHAVPSSVEVVQADLGDVELKRLFEGAHAVVHLAQADPVQAGDAHLAHRVLDAASAAGVAHLVLLSSATAYGAWANNPVPLTEDAPLRPNPGVALAVEKAEVERAAADWRDDHPGATVAVLRPTITVASEGRGWLARALGRAPALPVGAVDPPVQLLDVDDLATAVDLARRARLDGPRNVAPDGWLDGDTARALAGGLPPIRLPERLALRVAGWRWRLGLTETPPVLLPYTVHPWVVANARLRSDGWVPASSTEQVLTAHPPPPWTPSRTEARALTAAAAALVATVVVVSAARRQHRR